MLRYARIIVALAALLALTGCPNPSTDTPKDGTKAITAFGFASPAAVGVVDETNLSIEVTLPFGSSPVALVPTVAFTGASVSPASGEAHDFSSPATYTVTAADGSSQAYVVTVTAEGPGTFKVAFKKNADDASGTMADQAIIQDSSAALSPNVFTRNGYVFLGWATSSTGAVAYSDKASYAMGDAGVELYAVWLPAATITVRVILAPGGDLAVTGPVSVKKDDAVQCAIPAGMTAQKLLANSSDVGEASLAALRFSSDFLPIGVHRVSIVALDELGGESDSGYFSLLIHY